MATYKDYYQVLGVPKTATKQEIKSAFRKLAATYHPDKHPGDKAAEDRFKEINEAYAALSDEEKRRFYDQYGTAEGRPPFAPGADFSAEEFGDFSDFFQDLFGGSGFGQRGNVRTGSFTGGSAPFAGFQNQPHSRNVEGSIAVGLEEAYRGATTTITAHGKRIDVKLPKGVKDGARIRLRGQAPNGGDLYLTIKHREHSHFALEGDNVRVIVEVPDYKAVLGGPVRVPTLDGEVEMTLPKNTQAARVLRLRGQGWPKRDGSRGDELAEIRVVIPSALSAEQLELYKRLQDLSETRERVPG